MKPEAGRQLISPGQWGLLVLAPILTHPAIFLPQTLLIDSGRDSWLAALVASAGATLFFGLLFRVAGRADLFRATGGWGVISRGLALLLGVYLIYWTLLTVVEYARLMTMIMPDSPLALYILGLILLSTLANLVGIEPSSRLAGLFVPLTLVLLVITLAGNMPNLSPANLKPILLHGPASLWAGAAFNFLNLAQVAGGLLLLSAVKGEDLRLPLWPLPVAGAVFTLMAFEVIATFGVREASDMAFPSFEVAKMVKIDLFLSNLESLVASFGIMVFFQGMVSLQTMAVAAWERATGLRKRAYLHLAQDCFLIAGAFYLAPDPDRLRFWTTSEGVQWWLGLSLAAVVGVQLAYGLWGPRSSAEPS